jgi:hypothetical protein
MNRERLKWVVSGINFEKITDWEQEFLESVETYFDRHGNITDKQEAILERIYKEKGK